MKRLIVVILLILLIYFLAEYIMSQLFVDGIPAMVMFSGTSPSTVKDDIITYYRDQLGLDVNSLRAGEYALTSTYTDLDNNGKKDLLVILNAKETCGDSGCLGSIFLQDNSGIFKPIPFSYAVKDLNVLKTTTDGMHDLIINDDASNTMTWDGTTYVPKAQ